tara:strand:+ start:309 stop:617 length:309 start_codon:yes stop_codon:yes gene_type:complete
MDNIDNISTDHLKRLLEWGEWPPCCKDKVMVLIRGLLQERERADIATMKFNKIMSDIEVREARARGPGAKHAGSEKYIDGLKVHYPTSHIIGPDGFPQRGQQ